MEKKSKERNLPNLILGTKIYNALADLENSELISLDCFMKHVEDCNGDLRIKAIYRTLNLYSLN